MFLHVIYKENSQTPDNLKFDIQVLFMFILKVYIYSGLFLIFFLFFYFFYLPLIKA
jgi:hypothetical protein